MIVVLKTEISSSTIQQVVDTLSDMGLSAHHTLFGGNHLLAINRVPADFDDRRVRQLEGVQDVVFIEEPYQLASRAWKSTNTHFEVKGVPVGNGLVNVIAGPCAIESESQIFGMAEFLHKQHVQFIRGGAYKPRTSPYSFQGLGLDGLKLIREAADRYQLRVVTEVIDLSVLEEVYQYADVLQVGTRNMSNFILLSELGRIDKPVLLKRGMSARIQEWLMAAEYILSGGNDKVILCERGIRTFDPAVRNTLDIAAIPIAKELSHLPVFADPSHGTGLRSRVEPMAMASVAAGADGLILEVHPNPDKALSDGPQSLSLDGFTNLLDKIAPIAELNARRLDCSTQSFELSEAWKQDLPR